jgi:arylsulfatase A-like enzyme
MNFLKQAGQVMLLMALASPTQTNGQPNILIAITDDQSWEHLGAYGADWIDTPNVDRLAAEGVRFEHAYSVAPSCSPSRASLLTGRMPWQLQEGATLWSTVPGRYPSLMDVLEEAGYRTGYTRKGWGPGSDTLGGRIRNPAGRSYSSFATFNNSRPAGTPFCFWFGTQDPHRPFTTGSGLSAGKHELSDVNVPGFLPDATVVRSDLLDYGYEIERFDRELGQILDLLESAGELDNTLVIVTSDNGMPFPGAKANLYDHGVRVPLIMRLPDHLQAGTVSADFIAFPDLMPTLLAAAGVDIPGSVTGLNHWLRLTGTEPGGDPLRTFMPLYLERHSICRPDMAGYPMRGIRTREWLYIRNYEPDRWPAGDPPSYLDIDGSPSKSFLQNLAATYPDLFRRCFEKRPAEELYAIETDPWCMDNLAADPGHAAVKEHLRDQLEAYLRKTLDPRLLGFGFILEGNPYTRSSLNDNFGGVEVLGRYHPVRLSEFNDWLRQDGDGDAIPNLLELALFGDPYADEASVLSRAFINENATILSIPCVSGVWPWSLQLLSVDGLPFAGEIQADRIVLPLPDTPSPARFFRMDSDYQFSSP